MKASQCVVWADAMRVGLYGQVRRVWAPRGVKVRQAVQIVYRWAYLALAVDVRSGRLLWSWIRRLKAEAIAQVVGSWQADGVEVVVWDGARAHKAQQVEQVGVRLICQPPYAPELNPVERVFEELRRWVEGRVYADLAEKQRAVEAVLGALEADPERVKRLTGWPWILHAFEQLRLNMTPP